MEAWSIQSCILLFRVRAKQNMIQSFVKFNNTIIQRLSILIYLLTLLWVNSLQFICIHIRSTRNHPWWLLEFILCNLQVSTNVFRLSISHQSELKGYEINCRCTSNSMYIAVGFGKQDSYTNLNGNTPVVNRSLDTKGTTTLHQLCQSCAKRSKVLITRQRRRAPHTIFLL